MFGRPATSLLLLFAACLSSAVGVDVTANPGDTDVHVICKNGNLNVWKKDNKTIEASDQGYQLVPENNTLIIKTIDMNHLGVYMCTDGNEIEKISVFVPPFVKHFEKTKNMIQDDPLQLECKGYGYPTPVVEWFREGELKATDGDRITLKDTLAQADTALMTNGTIRIVRMAFEDAGDYECIATNDYGSSNATIKVQVKDKLAALWPFLGICAEVAILCTIIFIYEKRRAKKMQEEEERTAQAEEAEQLNANNDTKANDEVRQRK